MTRTPPLLEGQVITMATPDRRRWVRLLCFLRRRPVPRVTRDYVVMRGVDGRLELTEIEFGLG